MNERGSDYDVVTSVDLGWSPRNAGRTALACWRPGENPWWEVLEPGSMQDMLARLAPFRGERALVLLDIPLYGTEELSRERPFRPLDRALIACGIPLYPSWRAGSYGRELASAIGRLADGFEVVESYPNPVHRFMWLAQDEPGCLEGELRPIKALEDWRRRWPPAFKRGPLPERRKNLARLASVLARFLPGDYSSLVPGEESRGRELDRLGDVYDALVALRAGMEMARSSPWLLEARVEGHAGMIPLLADANLRVMWEAAIASTSGRSPRPAPLDAPSAAMLPGRTSDIAQRTLILL